MKKTIVIYLCCLGFGAAANANAQAASNLSLANVPEQVTNAQGNDVAGVKKLIEAFQVALFKGDPRAFANLFTEDADFTNVVDQLVHGREEIYQHHINVFKNRPATRTNNLLSYTVRFLKSDIAASEIKWDNKHTADSDGITLANRDGVWVSVMTKENGKWYFKIVRNVMLNDGTKIPANK